MNFVLAVTAVLLNIETFESTPKLNAQLLIKAMCYIQT